MQNNSNILSYITLDFKLIYRNKRIYTIIFLGLFFTIFLLVGNKDINLVSANKYLAPVPMLLFAYLISFISTSFAQFNLTWESSYSNLFFSQTHKRNAFLRSRYYVCIFLNLCMVLVMILILWYLQNLNLTMVYLLIASFLYSTGVNLFITLFFTKYNRNYADLNISNANNIELVNIYQFLSYILVYIKMYLLSFIFFGISQSINLYCLVFSLLGILGLLSHRIVLKAVFNEIKKEKYTLLTSYNDEYE